MLGGYSGGQLSIFACRGDVGPIKIPRQREDEQALFLRHFPTGYMAAENAQIRGCDTVAIWGCGPVGQFCYPVALMMGAGHVIAIGRSARTTGHAEAVGAETINFAKADVYEELMTRTERRALTVASTLWLRGRGQMAADAVLRQGQSRDLSCD